jgi:hypothetical protein
MRRVAVVGAGGAGKTTLARALGQARGLPVVHLAAAANGPASWPRWPATCTAAPSSSCAPGVPSGGSSPSCHRHDLGDGGLGLVGIDRDS